MTTETIKVKIPTFKTIIEIEGQELTLYFRALKRNEKLKIQADASALVDIIKKEDKTPEETKKIFDFVKEGEQRPFTLLEKVEGEVFIGNELVTLESIKQGDLPEYIYHGIASAFAELSNKQSDPLKAETKNDHAPDSLGASVSS